MSRRATTTVAQLTQALDARGVDDKRAGASGTGADLPPIDLARAARVLLLMSQERSPLYRRAATRWLSRYAAETPDLTPAMLADAADALVELERGDLDAAERLRAAVRRDPRPRWCV
jgi:hypothetical protein